MSDRRGRGYLTKDVNDLLKQIMTGEVQIIEHQRLTVNTICKLIEEIEGLDRSERPSVGAVADILKNWERIGYAILGSEPMHFIDFTEEGKLRGLDAMQADFDEFEENLPAVVKEARRQVERKRKERLEEARMNMHKEKAEFYETIADVKVDGNVEWPF